MDVGIRTTLPPMDRIDIRYIEVRSRDLDFDALACAGPLLAVRWLMLPPRWWHRIVELHPRGGLGLLPIWQETVKSGDVG
jgi:hypothetical protein